ncbi:MAG TPA: hypothetical protein VMM36_15005 [Opitutaceae bacterium]|nr:hypothetical protein [Opitutaceae bacterium]
MKTPSLRTIAAALLCVGISNVATAIGDTDSVVTAVFSRSFNGYERPAGPDGSPALQTYVVSQGGYVPGLGADPSIDNVKFAGIVRILGKYLANHGYFPAKDAKKADIMLVIHWGKTIPFDRAGHQNLLVQGLQGFDGLQQLGMGIGGSPVAFESRNEVPPSAISFSPEQTEGQVNAAIAEAAKAQMIQGIMEIRMGEQIRDDANTHNANLLGYSAELSARDNTSLFAGAGDSYRDLIADLETERYYVSVTAYDFQEALQHNTNKGLWRTVTSIQARGNRFDEKLIAMIEKSSRYFGHDSGRLVRQFDRTPRVSIGELKVLGVVEEESAGQN